MLNLNLGHEPDEALIVRTAWLYYVDGLTQEATGKRLGLPRTRVVRLLSEARNRGLVSITIQQELEFGIWRSRRSWRASTAWISAWPRRRPACRGGMTTRRSSRCRACSPAAPWARSPPTC